MRPVFVGTNVCFITGEIYFPSGRGHLVCFDKKSGDHTVAFNTPEPIASTPKVIDQTVLFATITGKICRFDVEKRSLQWCTETEASGTTLAGASYDPNTHLVVYPAMTKGLFVLDPDSGKILMQWNPKDPKDKWGKIYGDVSVSADRWIVSDNDGLLRALKPQFFPKTADNK
jgi:outer membrane protein assembly factor BamB